MAPDLINILACSVAVAVSTTGWSDSAVIVTRRDGVSMRQQIPYLSAVPRYSVLNTLCDTAIPLNRTGTGHKTEQSGVERKHHIF